MCSEKYVFHTLWLMCLKCGTEKYLYSFHRRLELSDDFQFVPNGAKLDDSVVNYIHKTALTSSFGFCNNNLKTSTKCMQLIFRNRREALISCILTSNIQQSWTSWKNRKTKSTESVSYMGKPWLSVHINVNTVHFNIDTIFIYENHHVDFFSL